MVSPCLWRIAQGSKKGMDIIVEAGRDARISFSSRPD